MKRYGRAIIVILLSTLMVCATACGGGSDVVPTPTPTPTPTQTQTPIVTPTPEPEMMPPAIGYLPEGWQLIFETYYGQYTEESEPKTGSLQYRNEDGIDLVYIKYGDLPDVGVRERI